jgi:hypothetical protein
VKPVRTIIRRDQKQQSSSVAKHAAGTLHELLSSNTVEWALFALQSVL